MSLVNSVRFIRVFSHELTVRSIRITLFRVWLKINGVSVYILQGKGIAGAKVYLNTEMKATTDSNGKYRLYNMTSGLYLFQAS